MVVNDNIEVVSKVSNYLEGDKKEKLQADKDVETLQ